MDDTVGRAWYELGAHDDRLDRDLDDADRKVKAAATSGAGHYEKTYAGASQKVSAGFGTVRNSLAAIGIGIGLTTVMSFFGGAIGAASDLNEEVSKAGVVFGASAGKVEDFADRADVALGQSKQQALAAAGGFGNMFRTIGFAEDAASDMSITMLQLASDMASFNNQDPSDMLVRLRAGLSGEAEPLRQFGVLLSEARVKEEAYATGIALVGKELTETQKVQARYSLILKDTTLQQGDFARTADGLANSQRIQAATWENSLARMGAALLPLAKEMTQFATDVLPGVADGLTSMLKAAAPLLGMFLTLAKLWLEHANVIVPALATAVGIKLAAAFATAETRARLMGLAAKAAWSAALVGLPILLEALEPVTDAANDFFATLGMSDEAKRRFRELQETVSDPSMALALTNMGVSAADFSRLMEATGMDADDAFRAIADNADHSADAVISAFNRVAVSPNRASYISKMTAAELRDGADEVAAGAEEGITNPIADAAREARKKAAEEARRIPAEIAAAIIEGRDVVLGAAEGLAGAATDPLLQQARVTEIRAQMKDLANVTADEITKATPATVAADKLKYAQLEIQLAGYLLRADPMSEEAANLLAKYANSADPATKAAYEALMGAVEDRAFIMANDVEADAERAGISVEEAFKRNQVAAAEAAAGLARRAAKAVQQELQFDAEAKQWGINIGSAWGGGVSAGIASRNTSLVRALGVFKAQLYGESPPKEGPLREIDKGGYNVGRAWGLGVSRGIDATGVLGMLGGPQAALATASTGAGSSPTAAASPAPGSGDTIFQLYYDGQQSSFDSAAEAIDELRRMSLFGDRSLAGV